VLVSKVE